MTKKYEQHRRWVDEQVRRTRKMLASVATVQAWAERVEQAARGGRRSAPLATTCGYVWSEVVPGQDRPRLVYGESPSRAAKVSVKASQSLVVRMPVASPTGRYLAVGVASPGEDSQQWQIHDLRGRAPQMALPRIARNASIAPLVWAPCGTYFYYSAYAWDSLSRRVAPTVVKCHRLGDRGVEDKVVYRCRRVDMICRPVAATKGELVIAETRGAGTATTLRGVRLADGRTAWTWDKNATWFNALVARDRNRLVIVTDMDAPRRRVIECHIVGRDCVEGKTIVGEQDSLTYLARRVGDDLWLVRRGELGDTIAQYGLDGRMRRQFRLPAGTGVDEVQAGVGDGTLWVKCSGFNRPPFIMAYVGGQARQLWSAGRSCAARVDIEEYKTYPGGKLYLSLVSPRGLAPKEPRPTLLSVYGGFGVPRSTTFSAAVAAWVSAGYRFASVGVRGGGDGGREQHRAGAGRNRGLGVQDFLDASRFLITRGRARAGQLGAIAHSNGALIAASCALAHPELFAVAIVSGGVFDLSDHQMCGARSPWSGEFKSRMSPTSPCAEAPVSPIDIVRKAGALPAFLVTYGARDQRVPRSQSERFVAQMQRAGSETAYLRAIEHRGHSASSSVRAQTHEVSEELAFAEQWLMAERGGV